VIRIDTPAKLALALEELENQLYKPNSPPLPADSKKDPYSRSQIRQIAAKRDTSFKELYLFAFELAKVGQVTNPIITPKGLPANSLYLVRQET
jgi:hypothetical protein